MEGSPVRRLWPSWSKCGTVKMTLKVHFRIGILGWFRVSIPSTGNFSCSCPSRGTYVVKTKRDGGCWESSAPGKPKLPERRPVEATGGAAGESGAGRWTLGCGDR